METLNGPSIERLTPANSHLFVPVFNTNTPPPESPDDKCASFGPAFASNGARNNVPYVGSLKTEPITLVPQRGTKSYTPHAQPPRWESVPTSTGPPRWVPRPKTTKGRLTSLPTGLL